MVNIFIGHENMRGTEVKLHAFLTLALDEGEWSASQYGCFTPGNRALISNWWEAVWTQSQFGHGSKCKNPLSSW
jgi:hypothetical protein